MLKRVYWVVWENWYGAKQRDGWYLTREDAQYRLNRLVNQYGGIRWIETSLERV